MIRIEITRDQDCNWVFKGFIDDKLMSDLHNKSLRGFIVGIMSKILELCEEYYMYETR